MPRIRDTDFTFTVKVHASHGCTRGELAEKIANAITSGLRIEKNQTDYPTVIGDYDVTEVVMTDS